MFITQAYAQTAAAAQLSSPVDTIMSLLPFVMIFIVMYFFIIRPQRQQLQTRDAMLAAVKRNDAVVLGGGIVGKVTKVVEGQAEVEVEIAPTVKVTVVRSMIADVRVKAEPIAANAK
jgi:preprotein translocase subunit YajC